MRLSTSQIAGIAAVVVVTVILTGVIVFGRGSDNSVTATISMRDLVHIHGIAVDPEDPDMLLLATHTGIYLASADGTSATLVSDNRDDFMSFSPDPGNNHVIYASGHPSQGGSVGVIISRDGGRTWSDLSQGARGPVDFHAMAVSAANPDVIYGHYAHASALEISRDGGSTWTIVASPPGVTDLAASSFDANIVYVATGSGLLVSRDAGETWQPTGPQGQPATMVESAPNGDVFAFVTGTGLVRAPAGTLAWTPVNNSVRFGSVLLHFAVDPNNANRMFAVDDEGRILVSEDGGLSWFPRVE